MKKTSYEEILAKLNQIDQSENYKEVEMTSDTKFIKSLENIFQYQEHKNEKSAVLGIDIYRYSKFEGIYQDCIPFIFKYIYNETVRHILKREKFLFQYYTPEKFENNLISTGDGGFQIFETPLHALTFAIHFEINVRLYNSYSFFPKLRKHVGPLTLRYAMTYEKLFSMNTKFYGPGIINNARLLSKDKLNRFLLDAESHEWFLQKFNGIETIKRYSIDDVSNLICFKEYKKEANINPADNIIFQNYIVQNFTIFDVINISKLRPIEVKETNFDVYNLFLQVTLQFQDDNDTSKAKIVVASIGNMNIDGINI